MKTDMNVGLFLTRRAQRNSNQPFINDLFAKQRLSFSQVNERANQLTHALESRGLRHGDRVAILAHNGHQFVESFFGPAKSGYVIMPLNWRLTADELAFILQDGGATALIFDEAFSSVVEQLHSRGEEGVSVRHWIGIGQNPPAFATPYEELLEGQPSEEPSTLAEAYDNLFIMYTSGTTGLPKGVVHTHEGMFWAVINLLSSSDNQASDRYLIVLPMFHIAALGPMIGATYRANALTIMREADPSKIWETIDREQITTTLCVPALLNFMLQVPALREFDHSSVRCILAGAAPVPEATIRAYIDLGIRIDQAYGLTENCGCGCLLTGPDALERVGSTGKAFMHTEVRVVDESGKDQPPNEPGEVIIRGRHVMKEYWNRPDATAETLRDGWLYTGDIATADADGFVTICDRKKDMIISGGENVYPAEVEAVLLQMDGVADAAVIGEPSERWGESPLAVIVRGNPDLSDNAILEHCNGRLARFKQPARVLFTDAIPRNPSGKILKRVLRETLLEVASG
ncbi:MAG: long-chain-fatty-acid--CoA ligase [Pseudomonadota bacterium]